MSTAEIRLLSGVALALSGLLTLATAAKAYGAGQHWAGQAGFALGFLLVGGSQLAFTVDSMLGAVVALVGAFLCLVSLPAMRRFTGRG